RGWLGGLAGGAGLRKPYAHKSSEENIQQSDGFFHTANLDCCKYNPTNGPCSSGKMASKKLSSCIYTNVETHKKALANVLNTCFQIATNF
ncbi:MAG TPA: hypothetical protein VNB54_06050, partial [Alphaproteobacteria bacterium]|nr:hypothetical protein [Alphaproteobacteria bacterium]